MPDDTGTTIGVFIPPGERGLVDRFDAAANDGEGPYSRSEHLRYAMEVYVGALEGLDMVDEEPAAYSTRELRDLVKWAIVDEFRAD